MYNIRNFLKIKIKYYFKLYIQILQFSFLFTILLNIEIKTNNYLNPIKI